MAGFTLKTIKQLFALSGGFCAFPGCGNRVVDYDDNKNIFGEICHIKAKNRKGPRYDPKQTPQARDSFENLILLCPNCHKKIDSSPAIYTADILSGMKFEHERSFGRDENKDDEEIARSLIARYDSADVNSNCGNLAINSPGSFQVYGESVKIGVVNIEAKKKNVRVSPPPDAIGSHLQETQYIKHLISRYNEFASKDPSRTTKFSYGVISANIKSRFKTTWELVPIERFGDVCLYLQERISRTRLAKINKGNGIKSFSTFQEFCAKLDQ
jgi:hypothetical protein